MVPQIVTKTEEVERAIVRVEVAEEAKKLLKVTTTVPAGRPDTTPSEEAFYAKLRESVGSECAEAVRTLVQHVTAQFDLVEKSVKKRLFVKIRFEIDGQDGQMWLLVFSDTGKICLGGQGNWSKGPLPRDVVESFWNDMGELLPTIRPTMSEDKVNVPTIPINDLLPKSDDVIAAIRRFVNAVEIATADE